MEFSNRTSPAVQGVPLGQEKTECIETDELITLVVVCIFEILSYLSLQSELAISLAKCQQQQYLCNGSATTIHLIIAASTSTSSILKTTLKARKSSGRPRASMQAHILIE